MKQWQLQNVLLGTGGSKPGVEIYDTDSAKIEIIHSLPDGESVYALKISPDGKTLAAGTKKGFLYLITPDTEAQNDQGYAVRRIIHGAPILSVCFLDSTNLAVGDTAGRCLIWEGRRSPSHDAC